MGIPPVSAPPAPDIVYVSFSAEINPNTTETLIATVSNISNKGVKNIYLMISTPGGAVMNGMNLTTFSEDCQFI